MTVTGSLFTGCASKVSDTRSHKTTGDVLATVQKMLAPCRGYSAEVEIRSLDPNGGFAHFRDEQNVSLPNRMFINRTILKAHNSDQEGANITIVVNHGQMVSRMTRSEQWGGMDDVTYRKTDLNAIEQAGGPSIPDIMADIGNLADPLRPYNLLTLTIEKETRREWILVGEFSQAGMPWRQNRITIDKGTGFLTEVEAIIPELYESVILLKVNRVSTKYRTEDSFYRLDTPPANASGTPFVMDDTDMWIESIRAQKQTHAEPNDPVPGSR